MKKFIVILLISPFIFGLLSCNKDQSNTDLLTQKAWKVKSVEYNYFTVGAPQSALDYYTSEQMGDQIKFNADGTYSAEFSNGNTETGPWIFSPSEDKIIFDNDYKGQISDWSITTLSGTTLTVIWTDDFGFSGGGSGGYVIVDAVVTFSH